jgi:glutamine amidotransferase
VTVTVVDMAVSNVGSVANMLRRLGEHVVVSSDPDLLADADRLVLPGVGSFDGGMQHLVSCGAIDGLRQAVIDRGVPLLGVCLGMQLLADGSEEGDEPGLGWIPGVVRRLQPEAAGAPLPVPHMGWNTVVPVRSSPLSSRAAEAGRRFYFVHSYALDSVDEADVIGVTTYGGCFTSMVERDNIVGAQFHPEKSHRHGMALLAEWIGI